jgi:hypothetical protein
MQHYLDITDPDLCVIEMDFYWAHVAQHQWRWRYDWEGNRVEDIFDPTDNAPGGSADPGQSLRHAKISAHNMTELRG